MSQSCSNTRTTRSASPCRVCRMYDNVALERPRNMSPMCALLPLLVAVISTASAGKIAQKKCEEYGEKVFLTNYESDFDELVDECRADFSASWVQALHGSGNATSGMEFTHMALIGYGDAKSISWRCSGSLISPEYVLTSAVCLNQGKHGDAAWVLLGEHDLASEDDGADPRTVAVRERIAHPEYRHNVRQYHDIGLLRLAEPVQIDKFVRPACLCVNDPADGPADGPARDPTESPTDSPADDPDYEAPDGGSDEDDDILPYSNGTLVRTGWSIMDFDHLDGGNRARDKLRKTAFFAPPQDDCVDLFTRVHNGHLHQSFPDGIKTESLMCARGINATECVGKGAPLLTPMTYEASPYCMYHIVAVASYDVNGCFGNSQDVFLFTKVAPYVPWIESVVWPNPTSLRRGSR